MLFTLERLPQKAAKRKHSDNSSKGPLDKFNLSSPFIIASYGKDKGMHNFSRKLVNSSIKLRESKGC